MGVRYALFMVLWVGFSVAAQAREPLRLAIVDASATGGQASYEVLVGMLGSSQDIALQDTARLWEVAEEFGLSRADFRSSSRRQESVEQFRGVMERFDLEALMIVDVFSKGRKFQLVSLGPDGAQAADIRRDIRRAVTQAQGREVLQESFREVVPLALEYRERQIPVAELVEPEQQRVEVEVEDIEEVESAADDEMDWLGRWVSGRVGMLLGSRDFEMTSGETPAWTLVHKSPFVGVEGRLDVRVVTFSQGTASLGVTGSGGYAPFTTVFDEGDTFESSFSQVGGEVFFVKAFSPALQARIAAGAEMWSVTVAQNAYYTGTRYTSARAGLGVRYESGPVALEVGGGILPTLSIENSDGAYGEGELMLGYEGRLGLEFDLFANLFLTAGYRIQSFSPEFPESRPGDVTSRLTSSEVLHRGVVMLEYGF